MNQLALVHSSTFPALNAASGESASRRFLEFFATNIRNPHTRRAYGRAVRQFLAWCDDQGIPSVADVQTDHVAAWIEAPIAYEHDMGWHAARRGDEVLGRRGVNHPDGSGSGEIFQGDPWRGNETAIATFFMSPVGAGGGLDGECLDHLSG
jgi:hypothetical protein